MSDQKKLDLNELVALSVTDFREMPVEDMLNLAVEVGKQFPGLSLVSLNPNYGTVLGEIEKTVVESNREIAFKHGKELYDSIKASALGSHYLGFRMSVMEGEAGLKVELSYITQERKNKDVTKATVVASKTLQI